MAPGKTTYTHGYHDSVLRSHRTRTARNSAAYLMERLRPGLSIVDIGCGPGTITVDLARLVAPGRVTALEISADALAEAEELAARQDVVNIDFVIGDVHRLEFLDSSFEVVHAHQVLQHLPDPVRALREMRRICRPDGVVAARDSDYAAMTWYPQLPELDDWLALYRRIARANGGEPDAGRRLLSWARQAGFSEITATASTWCYATAEARGWWGGMWSDRIRDSAIARQAVSAGFATETELNRISAGWREWATTDGGWFAVLHGEILATP